MSSTEDTSRSNRYFFELQRLAEEIEKSARGGLRIKILIRYKWCKTAMLFYIILFVFAILTSIEPRFYPLFTFFLVDFLLVVSAAFYLIIQHEES